MLAAGSSTFVIGSGGRSDSGSRTSSGIRRFSS
jgi:hypothetical protein